MSYGRPIPDKSEGDVNISRRRLEWQDRNLDDKTKALLQEDAYYFLHQALSTPCIDALSACNGSTITDLQGKEYLDFHGNSVHQLGYGHREVVAAVKEQLDTLSFSPRRFTNEKAVELARKLAEITPGGLRKSLFAPGGALAVGMALKLARLVTGRFKTVSWWGSFHGASLDAISVGGESIFRTDMGPMMPGSIHVPPPAGEGRSAGAEMSTEASLEHLEYVFQHEPDIAAFVAEPVRYTTVNIPRKDYWQGVRELCDKYGALLIFDEIPVGLGRTGYMFASEYYAIEPDILCLGKGLGGGVFPQAAIVTRPEYDIAGHKALGHYTHEKSPVGAAAALKTIEVIKRDKLCERSRSLGKKFLLDLKRLEASYEVVAHARGLGLLCALELADDESAEKVMYSCLERGLSFKVSSGRVLLLMPPLTISEEELNRSVGILEQSIKEL